MRAVMRQVEEIKRMEAAMRQTESEHLRRDYGKGIKRLKAELREYCGYRGLNISDYL